MGCCGKGEQDDEVFADEKVELKKLHKKDHMKDEIENKYAPYIWYPTVSNIQQIAYVRRLEKQHQSLQTCYLNLSTQMARLQFRLRQIIQADPIDRVRLIKDLERVILEENEPTQQCDAEELPSLEQHDREMGDIRKKQHLLIKTLRQQIGSFQDASNNLSIEYNYEDQIENTEHGINLDKSQKSLEKYPSAVSQLNATESQLRKTGGSEYFINSFTRSSETCSSYDRNETSVRSTSFKELREMYQKGCTKTK